MKSFQIKILRSSLLHMLCEVCRFVTYLSFECEMPSLHVLYSRTKMLKLRKSQTLHKIFVVDIFVAGFDDRTIFRDGIEEHICCT